EARGVARDLPRSGAAAGARHQRAARVDAAAALLHGHPPPGRPGLDRGAPGRSGGARSAVLPAASPAVLPLGLARAAYWRAALRERELGRGLPARPFAGLGVTRVAASNPATTAAGSPSRRPWQSWAARCVAARSGCAV